MEKEVAAIKIIWDALQPLSYYERNRVIAWVGNRIKEESDRWSQGENPRALPG